VTNSDSLPISDPPPCPCAGKCTNRKSLNAAESGEAPTPTYVGGLRAFETAQLFAGTKTVVIRHAGETYRLMITRNDRLILQK
jgi:hemin uptake protein HemP